MDIAEIFYSFLEFITFYITMHFFLNISFKPDKRDSAACLIIIFSFFLEQDSVVCSWLFGHLLYLGYAFTYRDRRLIDRFLLHCISYVTVVVFQLCLIFSLSFFHISFKEQYMSIMGNLLTIILLLCVFLFTPYRKLYQFISQSAFIYKMLLVNSYLIAATILLFMKIYSSDFYQNIFYLISITALMIVFNACILYYDQKLVLEHQQLVSYQKNLPVYKSLIDEIRASQHEFSNRIQNLEQLPYICKDYDSICTALLKNTNDYKKPFRAYSLLQLNMPLLAATLYNLYIQASDRNITILFDISSPNIVSCAPEYKLSDFINILTQNAIEACKSGDTIYTRIVSTEGRLHFEIRNPIERQISTTEISGFFQKNFSTKTEHKKADGLEHGMGLYYLANEIKSYKGTIGADCTQYDNCYWIIFNLEI